jgi:hypothetical protein
MSIPRVLRPLKLAALAVIATIALSVAVETAAAHSGPPSTYYRCTSRYGSGDSWETFGGAMYARPYQLTQFYTRIVPAYPFGWSGTWNVNGSYFHAAIWIPVGTSHWYPSPAIFLSSSGTYGWWVNVRPNPGVFNNWRLDLFAPYPCS